jgi:hypothetical protein
MQRRGTASLAIVRNGAAGMLVASTHARATRATVISRVTTRSFAWPWSEKGLPLTLGQQAGPPVAGLRERSGMTPELDELASARLRQHAGMTSERRTLSNFRASDVRRPQAH